MGWHERGSVPCLGRRMAAFAAGQALAATCQRAVSPPIFQLSICQRSVRACGVVWSAALALAGHFNAAVGPPKSPPGQPPKGAALGCGCSALLAWGRCAASSRLGPAGTACAPAPHRAPLAGPPCAAPCSNSLMHTRRVLLEAAADAASDKEARVEMEEAAAEAAEHARRHREAQRLFQRQAARAAEERKGQHSREQLRLEQLEEELQRQAAQVEQSAQVGRAGGGHMHVAAPGQNVGAEVLETGLL